MISVLLPVYNGGSYLKLAVESVLSQQNTAFEFLILDDCSTDESFSYLSSIIDTRIRLFRNDTNRGLFFNLNFLIGNAKGTLLKLWAQDDIMLPGCLETFAQFHSKHPEIGFSYCQPEMIDAVGNKKINLGEDKTPEIISKELHGLICMYTGSIAGNISNTCISVNALEKVGLFNQDMKISADFDMWVRIAEFFPVGHLNKKLIQMRDHEGQLSRNPNYLINHIREDAEVYINLSRYLDLSTQKKGKYFFRNYKLVFYYTLMLKFLIGFKLRNAVSIGKLIQQMDSFLWVSWLFFKNKIIKTNPKEFSLDEI